jgi:DNA-binding NarL/FixJ family response regulator
MTFAGARRSRIKILIVIDVRLYREGLAASLRSQDTLHVVGSVGSRAEALTAVVDLVPDLVIVDVALPEALDLMRHLRAHTPATRAIAFAVDEEIAAILDCAEAGAAGFVTANASLDEMVTAIERTMAGELLCSPRMAAELLQRATGRRPPAGGSGLTQREQEVLASVRQGLSNKHIASKLNIAEATVKNHVHHLLGKLDVGTRTQAAACLLPLPHSATLPPRPPASRRSG